MSKRLLISFFLFTALAVFAMSSRGWIPDDADGDGVPDSVDACPAVDASFFDRNGDGCIDDPHGARHLEYWGLEDSVITYVINDQGEPTVTNGSDFTAVQNAFGAWTSIAGTSIDAVYGGTTTQVFAGADGVNLVTFIDNATPISSLVLALGVATSFDSDTTIAGRLYRAGEIYDADMIFNPTRYFTTPSSGGAGTDIQSVATHEAGHMFGLSHSAKLTSTLFYVLQPGTGASTLDAEDESIFRKAYPDTATLTTANRIDGIVTDGNTSLPVPGVIVFAIDAAGDTVGCDYTLPDGSYTMFDLPDGAYTIAIHALDGTSPIGFIQPGNINPLVEATAVTLIVPEYWDLAESATDDPTAQDPITVSGGSAVTADLVTNVDNTPPSVVSVTPTAGTAGYAIDGAVIVGFDEAIDSGTLSGNFVLKNLVSGAGTAGSIAILKDDSLIAFTASPPMMYGTPYELTLKTGLADKFGNTIPAPYTITFDTEPEPPINVTSIAPSKGVVGTTVVINGTGFDTGPPPTVTFAGGAVAAVSSATPLQLTLTVPFGATTGNVVVENADLAADSISFTLLSSEEIARGFESGQTLLPAVPNAIAVTPSGDWAYVAHENGVTATIVNPAIPGYLNPVEISYDGNGIDGIAGLPDGRRMYGVSAAEMEFVEINSNSADPPGVFNEVLNQEPMDAEPIDIAVDPFGWKAYITTRESEIQVWDVKLSSVTFRQQVGVLNAPTTLQGRLAVSRDGSQVYALTDIGDLLIYDLGPDTLRTSLSVGPDPRDIQLDPVGQRAYVTHGNGDITIVSLTGTAGPFVVTDVATGGSLRGQAVTPAGSYLYATDREQDKMKIVDLVESSATWRTTIADFPLDIKPRRVAMSPDGFYAFSLLRGGSTVPPRMLVTTIGLGPELHAVTPRAGVSNAVLTVAGSGLGTLGGFSCSVLFNGGSAGPIPPAWEATSWGVRVPALAMSGPVKTRQIIDVPPHDIEESNEIYFEKIGPTDPAAAIREIKRMDVPVGFTNGSIAKSADGRALYLGGGGISGGIVYVYDVDPTSSSYETLISNFTLTSFEVDDIAIMADGKIGFAVDNQANQILTFRASRFDPNFGTAGPSLDYNGFSIPDPARVVTSPDNQYVAVYDNFGSIFIVDASGVSDGVQPVVVDQTTTGPGVNDMLFGPYGLFLHACQDSIPRVFSMSRLAGWTLGDVELLPPPPAGFSVPTSMDIRPDNTRLYVQVANATSGDRTVVEYVPPDIIDPLQPDTLTFVNIWVQGSTGQPLSVRDVLRISPHNDRAAITLEGNGVGFFMASALNEGIIPINTSGLDITSAAHGMEFSIDGDRLYVASVDPGGLQVFDFEGSANMLGSGDNQTGVINEVLASPIRVTVVDPATTTPLPGAQVTFTVKTGGGGVGFGSSFVNQVVTLTDAQGRGQTQWKLGPVIGDQTVEASVTLIGYSSPSPLTFHATAVGVPDSVPLTFNTVAPANGTADVGVNTPVLVTFNRGVNRSTVSSSSLYLRESGGTSAVPAAYGYTQGDAKVSLTPLSSLANGTTYEVIVTAALEDTSGNNLTNPPAPGSESFSTVAAGPPQLYSVNPPGGVITSDVVLSGVNFDATPSNNTVLFNSVAAIPKSGNTGELIVTVPKLAVSGDVRVVVGPDTTDAVNFNVLTPSSTTIDEVIATVGTGQGLRGVAVGPDGSVAYCVSPDGDVVIPVSSDSLTSLPSITVGDQPVAIAIDPLALLAYVCNFNSNTVSVIDVNPSSPDYNTVVSTIIVGSNPVDVCTFPGTVFIANAGSSNISVIDSDPSSLNQNAVIATIGTGSQGARGVAVAPDGGRLYVGTDYGFVVIDLSTNGVIATVGTGTGARGVAVAPDGSLLYLLGTDGDLYVIDVQEGSSTENSVIATIGTGGARGVAVAPDGGTLYLIQDDTDEVIVVSVSVILGVSVHDAVAPSFTFEWEIVDTFHTGSDPAAIAFDPRGQGLFYVAVAGEEEGLEVRGTGLGDLKVTGEVTPQTLNLDSKGRWVSAWMEFPPPYHPNQVDVSTVLLNDTVPAVPDKVSIKDSDGNGVDELHVKFDRGDFQLAVPNGDQVPVWVTGELPGRTFTMCDTIRTIRPTIVQPTGGQYVPVGHAFTIAWQSPADKTVEYVDVEWSADDGLTWSPVAIGVPDLGVAVWNVPEVFSEHGRVSVTLYDKGEPIGIGMSEPFFMSVPVAIRLASFQIRIDEGAAVLSWETASEVNVDSYRLVRSTDREGLYAPVKGGTVKAADNLAGGSYELRDATIEANRTYYYKLEEITSDGNPGGVYGPYQIAMRLVFSLEQNHPNPFNPTTTIKFAIPSDSQVRLDVFDVAGRRVATLVDERLRANFYSVEWNGMNDRGSQVASGVYFYRLVAGNQTQTRKMVMLK